jgi:hypothetical protein
MSNETPLFFRYVGETPNRGYQTQKVILRNEGSKATLRFADNDGEITTPSRFNYRTIIKILDGFKTFNLVYNNNYAQLAYDDADFTLQGGKRRRTRRRYSRRRSRRVSWR